jgi:hypothetical protein
MALEGIIFVVCTVGIIAEVRIGIKKLGIGAYAWIRMHYLTPVNIYAI